MLDIYTQLFKQIESSGIAYCSWKNNHLLHESLEGKRDIDLLVDINDLREFEALVVAAGFVYLVPAFNNMPSIKHFYFYDAKAKCFAHLHVYYRVITGESLFKNYQLPIENALITRAFTDESGVRVASFADQYRLHAIRYFIKASSIPSLAVLLRDRKDYSHERKHLADGAAAQTPHATNPMVLSQPWEAELGAGLPRSYYLGFKVRRQFKDFRLKTGVQDFMGGYLGLFNLVKGRVVKTRGKRGTGLVVALTGLDGSGKSSAALDLVEFASQVVSVRHMHFGRPPGTLPTLPATVALEGYKYLKRSGAKVASSYNRDKKTSLIQALRLVCLSYDRRVVMRKVSALRAKGYLVIMDRCPIETIGCMDAPKIISPDNAKFTQWLQKLEQRNYAAMPLVDHAIMMRASMDTAIARNDARDKADKETADEIRDRFAQNHDAQVLAGVVHEYDTEKTLERVRMEMRELLWGFIRASN